MDHGEVNPCKGFEEGNLFIHVKIGTLSHIDLVWPYLDNEDNISWFDLWNAISFAVDSELLAIWRTLINFDGEGLLVSFDLLSLANLTSFCHVDDLSLATTFVARTCALRIHSWTHLPHDSSHTASFATSTCLDSWCISSSDTIASCAYPLTINLNFDCFSIVDISEAHLDMLSDGFNSSLPFCSWASSSTAHKHGENVIHSSGAASTTFKSFHAVFVIDIPFILVE